MRFCLTLDLVPDAESIATYEAWHREVWPEIVTSIRDAGILSMEIYRASNRLFMIIDTLPTFSFAAKASADAANPRVREWEFLMSKFQQPLPFAAPGEKWVPMERIFNLPEI